MEHGEIYRKLSAYLENAVSAEEKEEIKRHLGSCGICRVALADLEMTVGHLKSLPTVEPPPWLTEKIMAKVRESTEQRPSPWLRLFFSLRFELLLGAVALLFLCVIGYYLARTSVPQVPLTAPSPLQRGETRRPAPASTGLGQFFGDTTPLSEPPSPVLPAPPVPLPSVPPKQTESPGLAPSALAPAPMQTPAGEPVEPGLQPADEGFMPQGEPALSAVVSGLAPRRTVQRSKESAEEEWPGATAPGAAPAEKMEVFLKVSDPAAAARAIEQAVTRSGGTVSGRASGGGSHFVAAQIELKKARELLDRLDRVGTMRERPQLPPGERGQVDLVIRW